MTQEPQNQPREQGLVLNAPVVVDILYLIGFATGISALAGLVIAYLKREEAQGTWMESHFTYLIRTFWFGLLTIIVGGFLTMVFIGWLVLAWWAVWTVVRTLRSLLQALEEEPVGDPDTLLW